MGPPRTPAWTAAFDQLRAELDDVAECLGNYRKQLITHGFTEEDALELCLDMQRSVLFRSPDEDDD